MAAASAQVLPADKMRDLASRPGVTVYEYAYDRADATMGPEQQMVLLRRAFENFDRACRESPPGTCDEALREAALASDPALRDFQRLFPATFAKCTVRALGPDARKRLSAFRNATMAHVMEECKRAAAGDDDEDAPTAAQRAEAARANAMRYSLREAVPADTAPGTLVTDVKPVLAPDVLNALTPVDPTDFGLAGVKQK